MHSRLRAGRFAPVVRAAVRAGVLALAGALLAGCSVLGTYMPVMDHFGVYRLDINQGNFLAQDQVDRLKAGQTPQQVRQILGTPLMTTPFRPERWDYVYMFTRQGRLQEHRNFSVYFVEGKLARWEGDEMPQSVVALNKIAASKALPPDPSYSDKGFLGWFLDIFRN